MPGNKLPKSFEPQSPDRPSEKTPAPRRNNMRLVVAVLALATLCLAVYANSVPNAGPEERSSTTTSVAGLGRQPPTFKYNHVGISVQDLPAQIKWYGDVLGFHKVVLNYTALQPLFHTVQLMNSIGTVVELQRHADSARLDADEIINPLDRARYQGIFHLALKVNDINATYKYLGQSGATPVAPPSWVDPYGWSAFVADPERNIIEIVHYTFD